MLTSFVEHVILANEGQATSFADQDVPEIKGHREDFLAAVFVWEAFLAEASMVAHKERVTYIDDTIGITPLRLPQITALLNTQFGFKAGELRINHERFLIQGLNYLHDVGMINPAVGDSGIIYYAKQGDERKNSKLKRAQIAAYRDIAKRGLTVEEFKREKFEALMAA